MTFPLPPAMRRALDLAAEAAAGREVPVGAVVTLGDTIIAEARNTMRNSPTPQHMRRWKRSAELAPSLALRAWTNARCG